MKPPLGFKSRILNLLRKKLFSNYLVEKFLLGKTLKYGDYSFWKKFIAPYYDYPEKTMRLVTRRGINFNLDLSNLVEYVIYWYGCVDENQDQLFADLKENGVVIDVGVNIGGTLLQFAKRIPCGQIIGFEPDSINYEKASENISLNSFKNIKLFKNAVGDKEGFAELYRIDSNNPGMNRILNGRHNFPYEKVKIITLDDFAIKNKLERVDAIKIDTEGFEINVLRGAEQILRKFKPVLFVEVDDKVLKERGYSPSILVGYLQGLGYTINDADDNRVLGADSDLTGCHTDIICR